MDDRIEFNEEASRLIAEGKLVPFSVLLYKPEDDTLVMYRLWAITDEEVRAMLRKFAQWPVGEPH